MDINAYNESLLIYDIDQQQGRNPCVNVTRSQPLVLRNSTKHTQEPEPEPEPEPKKSKEPKPKKPDTISLNEYLAQQGYVTMTSVEERFNALQNEIAELKQAKKQVTKRKPDKWNSGVYMLDLSKIY